MNGQCVSCHADPRQNPPVRGPLTIFSYATMKGFLAGATASDNGLLRKVRNIDTHGGGDRCRDLGPTTTPCKELMDWWRLEFGADAGLDGKAQGVTSLGDVTGYAVDTRDESALLTVRIYVDDADGGGTPAVEGLANASGFDGGYKGDHAFRLTLPAAARDGKQHTLYLFAVVGGKEEPIGTGVTYTAWTPKAAGRTYFTNTIQPVLQNRCGTCHPVSYDQQYVSLIAPTPTMGGTALNNELINRANGSDGHPGGNLCGTKNGSPCNLFQTWWGMEFGP